MAPQCVPRLRSQAVLCEGEAPLTRTSWNALDALLVSTCSAGFPIYAEHRCAHPVRSPPLLLISRQRLLRLWNSRLWHNLIGFLRGPSISRRRRGARVPLARVLRLPETPDTPLKDAIAAGRSCELSFCVGCIHARHYASAALLPLTLKADVDRRSAKLGTVCEGGYY